MPEANDLLNIFTKGIVDDLDPLMVSNNQWVFPTLNIRVLNKEGQGVIATVMDGNDLEFSLFPGFLALGACEFNGIVYIISYNKTTVESEIGCFPSPNSLDYPLPHSAFFTVQMQRVYRQLRNFTLTVNTNLPPDTPQNTPRSPFRTDLFNNDLQHQVSMFPKESYDGSVDLYMCDHKNPNRVINSGFDQSGMYLDRLYWNGDFFASINQIQGVGTVLDVSLNSIDALSQASLLCGIYFASFRYVDANMNATAFVSESNACQVFQGDMIQVGTIQGGISTKNSNKKIVFDLINVDTSYTYVQVVMTRYYSNVYGLMLHESFLVSILYNIIGDTLSITINGNEVWEDFDEALLLKPQGVEICCKDHLHINNRYYGANWKSAERHHQALVDFAQQIEITFDHSLTKDAGPMDEVTMAHILGQYTDYQYTYKHVGYFRGETYAFGLLYRFGDGSLSDVYPMKGRDEYLGAGTGATNTEGIYRFPKQEFSPAFTNDKINILGVKFVNTDAIAWLGGTGPVDEVKWFNSNVRAIYYVRVERKPTLVTQGVTMNVCLPSTNHAHSYDLTTSCSYDSYHIMPGQDNSQWNGSHTYGQLEDKFTGHGIGGGYSENYWSGALTNGEWSVEPLEPGMLFPIHRGYMPMLFYKKWNDSFRYYLSRWFLQPNKYAFYSPDMLFNPSPDMSGFEFMKRVGKTMQLGGFGDKWLREQTITDIHPEYNYAEMIGELVTSGVGIVRPMSKIHKKYDIGNSNIVEIPNNVSSYCNHFTDARNGDDPYYLDRAGFYMYKHLGGATAQVWSNRDVFSAPYIAIEINDDSQANLANYNLDIVNIYNSDIEQLNYDILTLYGMSGSTVNTQLYYSKISGEIKIDIDHLDIFGDYDFGLSDPITGAKSLICYKGDCFLQKFYFKQMSWLHSGFHGYDGARNPVGFGVYQDWTGEFSVASPSAVYDAPDGGEGHQPNRYAHGLIMGIVVESNVNPAMRHQTDPHEFYPHVSTFSISGVYDNKDWGVYPQNNTGYEEYGYNYGYHRQLSLQEWIHYNPYITYQVLNHKTRIRHSPLNIPYALTDAYRVLNAGDFKDYDLAYNQIVALIDFHGMLISVQEGAINEHSIEQVQLKAPQASGDLILGLGAILSPNVKRIADYGSQHQWSVHKLGYGVDWKKRVIWGLGRGSSSFTEYEYSKVRDLGREGLIEKWIYSMFDTWDKRTDIVNIFPDTPVYGKGIVTGYNPKYREVIFTFLLKKITGWIYDYKRLSSNMITLLNIHGGIVDGHNIWLESQTPVIYVAGTIYPVGTLAYDEANNVMYYICTVVEYNPTKYSIKVIPTYADFSRSLVYSTDIGAFIGEVSFTPNIYMNINNEMFTNKSNHIYLHDYNTPALFYGVQYKGIISYIINGGDKYRSFVKVFTNHSLESTENPFSRILYETQYQQSIHTGSQLGVVTPDDFTTDEFWRNPEYNEHKWELPIFIQTSPTANDFNIDSEMRGYWLKVTVEYFKNIPQYLKKTITKFIVSKTI